MILQQIRCSGGSPVAIICDNNRVNQSFFKKFECTKPWCTIDNVFLLFDTVHLLKSIRNNWLTEKTQELKYYENGNIKVAKWNDLKNLHEHEKHLFKLSKLNDTSVAPKPIERQNVSTCLKVFCYETYSALKTYELGDDVDGTLSFLSKFIKFFNIVNVKGQRHDVRSRDPTKAVIKSAEDDNLKFLLELADFADQMKPKGPGKREKNVNKGYIVCTFPNMSRFSRSFKACAKYYT